MPPEGPGLWGQGHMSKGMLYIFVASILVDTPLCLWFLGVLNLQVHPQTPQAPQPPQTPDPTNPYKGFVVCGGKLKFTAIAQEFSAIAPNLGAIAPKFGAIAQRFGAIARNLGAIAPKFGATAQRLGAIAPNLGTIAQCLWGLAWGLWDRAELPPIF